MKIPVFILVVLGLVMQCEQNDLSPSEDAAFSASEVSSLQKTSAELYSRLWEEMPDDNFVISPLSIQLALYMAWNGADTDTRKEIGALLHTALDENASQELTKDIHSYFHHLVEEGSLGIFNSLFYDDDRIKLRKEYYHIIQKYFEGDVVDLDFSSGEAVSIINEWASEKTAGRIGEIIDDISPEELLFLINALYLKADWDHPFPPETTTDRTFYLENGEEIEIPTMARTGLVERLDDPGLKMIRLPLADTTLYMYFFRPSDEVPLSHLQVSELFDRLWNDKPGFTSQRVMLSLPVFETRTHMELNAPLKKLGMTTAFDPQNADFSKIGSATTGRPLFISRSLHDAYLRVDEKGVEGAAVTTLGIGTTSAPPAIRFDRPFVYMIADKNFHLPLFIGQFTGIEPENP